MLADHLAIKTLGAACLSGLHEKREHTLCWIIVAREHVLCVTPHEREGAWETLHLDSSRLCLSLFPLLVLLSVTWLAILLVAASLWSYWFLTCWPLESPVLLTMPLPVKCSIHTQWALRQSFMGLCPAGWMNLNSSAPYSLLTCSYTLLWSRFSSEVKGSPRSFLAGSSCSGVSALPARYRFYPGCGE